MMEETSPFRLSAGLSRCAFRTFIQNARCAVARWCPWTRGRGDKFSEVGISLVPSESRLAVTDAGTSRNVDFRIGIAGPSCSGKTTLARQLVLALDGKLFSLDDYYVRGSMRKYGTCERPENYDDGKLYAEIDAFAVEHPGRHIVVEGFLLFLYPRLVFSHMFFIDIPDEIAVARRRARLSTADGKAGSVEEAWFKTGLAEWKMYGAKQAQIPGIIHLPHEGSEQLELCMDALRIER